MEQSSIETAQRQLRTLAILHYIWGGLNIAGGIALIIIYTSVGIGMVAAGAIHGEPDQIALGIFAGVFIMFAFTLGFFIIASAVLSIVSASLMLKRKNRVFSIVIAGTECANAPLGVLLGVFTIVILSKPELRELYNANNSQ